MLPSEVTLENEQQLLNTVYNYKQLIAPVSLSSKYISEGLKKLDRRKAKYKIGEYVRLSKYRMVFDKGYTPNWTTEVFKIRKVQYNTDPITYLLKDYKDKEIKGSVYEEELQRVKHPNIYLIEKIIRRKNGEAYVKWLGFDSEHNSWISERDIL